ncbi:MAG: hypothetical protein WBA92_01125 [Pseudorhodobacter sp.]
MQPTSRFGLPVFLALSLSALSWGLATAQAQEATTPPSDLTSPEGAAFIHQTLKDQILSFKEDGDIDYIYFTGILSWRCGVQELYYGLNDDLAVNQFPLEPCHRDLRQPNTSKDRDMTYPFFITVPKGSAQKVKLRIIYEDGNSASFESERAKNLVF